MKAKTCIIVIAALVALVSAVITWQFREAARAARLALVAVAEQRDSVLVELEHAEARLARQEAEVARLLRGVDELKPSRVSPRPRKSSLLPGRPI